MSHYATLEVEPSADPTEIKRAYRRLARLTHPDLGGPETVDRFREVQAAWEVLSDPAARAAYDRNSGVGSAASEPEPQQRANRPAREEYFQQPPPPVRPAPEFPTLPERWKKGRLHWVAGICAAAAVAFTVGAGVFENPAPEIANTGTGWTTGGGAAFILIVQIVGALRAMAREARRLPWFRIPLGAGGLASIAALIGHGLDAGPALAGILAGVVASYCAPLLLRRHRNIAWMGLGGREGSKYGVFPAAATAKVRYEETMDCLGPVFAMPGTVVLENVPVNGSIADLVIINGYRVAVIASLKVPKSTARSHGWVLRQDDFDVASGTLRAAAESIGATRTAGWFIVHPYDSGAVDLSAGGVYASAVSPNDAAEAVGEWLVGGSGYGTVDLDFIHRVVRGRGLLLR